MTTTTGQSNTTQSCEKMPEFSCLATASVTKQRAHTPLHKACGKLPAFFIAMGEDGLARSCSERIHVSDSGRARFFVGSLGAGDLSVLERLFGRLRDGLLRPNCFVARIGPCLLMEGEPFLLNN